MSFRNNLFQCCVNMAIKIHSCAPHSSPTLPYSWLLSHPYCLVASLFSWSIKHSTHLLPCHKVLRHMTNISHKHSFGVWGSDIDSKHNYEGGRCVTHACFSTVQFHAVKASIKWHWMTALSLSESRACNTRHHDDSRLQQETQLQLVPQLR